MEKLIRAPEPRNRKRESKRVGKHMQKVERLASNSALGFKYLATQRYYGRQMHESYVQSVDAKI